MRKIFFQIFIFLIALPLSSQDSLFVKKKLTTTAIKTFFSAYTQDGEHSVVTGGIGTEDLQVYGAGTSLKISQEKQSFILEVFADVISSASTDNINFVKSSASSKDIHLIGVAGYQRKFNNKITGGIKYRYSMESDYRSHGLGFWSFWNNKKKTQRWAFSADIFLDDLRWGYLTNEPQLELVYPSELRNVDWFDIYHRHSFNFNFSFQQDINRRLTTNFSAGMTTQRGLLSTPFHRVYFSDGTKRVEKFPNQRWRIPIAVAANWFALDRFIFKGNYRFYWDDFDIFAHSFDLEIPVKLNPAWSIYPFGRIYQQSASAFFQPYRQHDPAATFYTSDYDLSEFWSFKIGMGAGYFPNKRFKKTSTWFYQNIKLRYAYFWRTDGLQAHILSMEFGILREKWK